jgi:O-antigen/teichoic acid export membrane protein
MAADGEHRDLVRETEEAHGGPVPAEARLDLEGAAEEVDVPPAEAEVRPEEGFRARTARGVLIVSGFRIGLAGLNLSRTVVLAAFLTRAEYGLWGLIVSTLITLAFLKQVGITDKYVQQRESNQEHAFQKAFTLELAYSGLFYLVVAIALPIYALLVYDRPEVLAPAAVLSVSLLLSAFQAPTWVFYRRLQYARQLTLESVDPVVTSIATIALLVAGMGIWGLVVGSLVGSIAGALFAVAFSPYRLRLRFDRGTLREYVGFSWPLLFSGISGLLVVQGALIVGNAALGLAAVGSIGLAASFARFSNRVDMLLRRTLYPAVAAVRERREVMLETFEKSNRLGLMWALPFGIGLALFAGELVHYVLGERWEPAVPLLRVFGLLFAGGTIGFAWATFYQAQGNTRPIAVAAALTVVTFFAVTMPLMLTVGVMGYAYGMATAALVQFALRGYYLRRLFPGFRFLRHTARALLPSVPAVAAVLALRLAGSADAGGPAVIAELVAYVAVTAAATYLFERKLLAEAFGYLRGALTAMRHSGPESEPAAV